MFWQPLKQRLHNQAVDFYHSNLLIPHRLKRKLKQRVLDPVTKRLYLRFNSLETYRTATSSENDLLLQREANMLHAANSFRDLNWFLTQNDAVIHIGFNQEIAKEPLVSIVIILYNKAHLSYACLRSLEQLRYRNIELVIIDNASTDQTPHLLKRLEGRVQILQQEENIHFLKGCNLAFSKISPASDFVLLVNNDAMLDPMAINQALEVFKRWPETGIVGGQVLHLDGRLQEAGNVIFKDGICSGLGRRQSPWHPLAQVRRKVDYVSGCLLMIETRWLHELGGFDERFAPAYYEETDLCIRSWQSGRPVVYEPSCQLKHIEFASSEQGRTDAEELMQKNRAILEKKHHQWLQRQPSWEHHQDLNSIQTCLRSDAYPARIMWIDDRDPDPRFGAGYGRMRDLIEILSDLGAFITVFATHQQPDSRLHAESADYELAWGGLRELEALISQRPGFYTHICASRHHNLRLLQEWHRRSAHTSSTIIPCLVGDVESLFSIREHAQRHLKRTGNIINVEADQLLGMADLDDELKSLQDIDRFITVSKREANLLYQSLHKPVEVAGHAFRRLSPNEIPLYNQTNGLLFMGAMNHPGLPNLDSLLWLAQSILPSLISQNILDPNSAPLTVIGPYSEELVNPLLDAIASLWPVRHLGQVDDIDKEIKRHRIVLAPTRFAAGLPHKVQHAISQGIPVVTTNLISSQMEWKYGEGLMSSNDPSVFASLISDLYTDQDAWEQTQKAGLAKISDECRRDKIKNSLIKTFFEPFSQHGE